MKCLAAYQIAHFITSFQWQRRILAITAFCKMFEQHENLSIHGIAVMYQLYLCRGNVTVHISSRALFNPTSIQ